MNKSVWINESQPNSHINPTNSPSLEQTAPNETETNTTIGTVGNNSAHPVAHSLPLKQDDSVRICISKPNDAPIAKQSGTYGDDIRIHMPTLPNPDSIVSPTVQFCRKCGNKLTSDSLFCNKCGTKIIEYSSQNQAPSVFSNVTNANQNTIPTKSKRTKTILIAVGIFTALIIIATIVLALAVPNYKYNYVLEHYDRNNLTTFEYLKDLKERNYKDSVDLYEELYGWQVTIIAINSSETDETTDEDYISKYSPVYFHIKLTGGEPNKKIRITVKSTLPNGVPREYIFDNKWGDDECGWYGWYDGIYDYPEYSESGTLQCKFYDEDGNLIGKGSVIITDNDPLEDYFEDRGYKFIYEYNEKIDNGLLEDNGPTFSHYVIATEILNSNSEYYNYIQKVYEIAADGNSFNNYGKNAAWEYINDLPLDNGEKLILFKLRYSSDHTYDEDIIEYLSGRNDISEDSKDSLLRDLGLM